MKQAIQLKVGQSLTMTPQLQQAIKLLQMSSLDLQQEITRVLEENPLLEREDEIELVSESSENPIKEHETPVDSIEVAIETDWSDTNHFDVNRPMTRTASDDEYDSFENRTSENLTLADHLLWQLNLMPLTERDMLIARVLIDSINSDGFLDADLEEITKALAEELEDLEYDEVECVLHQIQRLDPVGIGARGIAESLKIQLAALGLLGGDVSLPLKLVQNHLELLTKKDRAGLKRALNCDDKKLDTCLLYTSPSPRDGLLSRMPSSA